MQGKPSRAEIGLPGPVSPPQRSEHWASAGGQVHPPWAWQADLGARQPATSVSAHERWNRASLCRGSTASPYRVNLGERRLRRAEIGWPGPWRADWPLLRSLNSARAAEGTSGQAGRFRRDAAGEQRVRTRAAESREPLPRRHRVNVPGEFRGAPAAARRDRLAGPMEGGLAPPARAEFCASRGGHSGPGEPISARRGRRAVSDERERRPIRRARAPRPADLSTRARPRR